MKHWRPEGHKPFSTNPTAIQVEEMGYDRCLEDLRKLPKANHEGGGLVTGNVRGIRVTIPDDPPGNSLNWRSYKESETQTESNTNPALAYYKNPPFRTFYVGWHKIQGYRYNTPILIHPATKVIETGYFCPKCGTQIPNFLQHWCEPSTGRVDNRSNNTVYVGTMTFRGIR